MAGVSRLQYATDIRLIRVMCSGKVDLSYIFRAFMNGMDGVFVGACRLGECNYITHGNYSALKNVLIARKIMGYIGIDPERLWIRFMNSSDGQKFAENINAFISKISKLGPLGSENPQNGNGLKPKLEAVQRIVPYLRLVERERLRASLKTEEEHRLFFEREDINKLIRELVYEKLTMAQIMELLKEKTLSIGEIAKEVALTPSEAAKYLGLLSKQGFVRFDQGLKGYGLAGR
jgi:F420-non-reducing hydrogenase iron-sulfur subunit